MRPGRGTLMGHLDGCCAPSFVFEALCVALIRGLLGCLAVWPLNGLTTGAMNWQTFARLAFAFRVTPFLLLLALDFALFMGLVGGVPRRYAPRGSRSPWPCGSCEP